jgi:hypothetical protein
MITSPLIQAILDGRINMVRDLIRNNPEMLGIRSEIGSLPYQIACNKGLVNQQTALIRANAPGSENFKAYSALLIDYLSEISENYACAGWLIDIEFIIWKVVFTKQLLSDDCFRFNEIDEETKEDLRFLSQKANGWAGWTDDESEAVFVPLEKWKKMWEEYQK